MKTIRLNFHEEHGIKNLDRIDQLDTSPADRDLAKTLINKFINQNMSQFRVFHTIKYLIGFCTLLLTAGLILLILKYTRLAVWFLVCPLVLSLLISLYACRKISQQKYVLVELCEAVYNRSGQKLLMSFSFKFQMISHRGMDRSNSKTNYLVIELNSSHPNFHRKKSLANTSSGHKEWEGDRLKYSKPKTMNPKEQLFENLV